MCKYLGTIGTLKNSYKIVAFTNDKSFGPYDASEIGDHELYQKMIKERFKSLKAGRAIYCTAVNVDIEKEVEQNPHDDRPGTVHIAAIDERTGKLSCILSAAVDTGEKDGDELIGLPLENRWKQNGYSKGDDLDKFREKYLELNRGENGPVRPWQMAELYRHLRVNGDPGEQISRLGIYVGLYHLLILDRRIRGLEETSIWIFDAIPKYFHLYRLAGAAVLRSQVIEDSPRYISPNVVDIKEGDDKHLLYKGEVISRNVETLKPNPGILGDVSFTRENVPFLDGVIDVTSGLKNGLERNIIENPIELPGLHYDGMSGDNVNVLSVVLSTLMWRFHEKFDKEPELTKVRANKDFVAPIWNFNGVGKI